MALAMTAVLDTSSPVAPFYLVTVSGLSGITGATSVTVFREYPDFGAIDPTTEIVRGLNMAPVTGDTMDAQDFEVKFMYAGDMISGDGSFNYHVFVYDINGATLSDLVVAVDDYRDAVLPDLLEDFPGSTVLIQSVSQPALNVPSAIAAFDGWSVPGRILSTNYILGRVMPVVIGDVMGARTGTFTLLVSSDLTGQDLDTTASLLTFNDVLLFNPYYGGTGYAPMYFKVTNVTPTRLTPANADQLVGSTFVFEPNKLWYAVAVDFTEVDNPSTNSAGPVIATWQDILDNFATWTAVSVGRTSWLDVLNRADEP